MKKWLVIFTVVLFALSLSASILVGASLSAVTSTGAGSTFNLPANNGPWKFTWQVTFTTAAPGGQTTNLEGSLDGTNWYTLDSSTTTAYTSDTVSGEMRHVINKQVRKIRCNLASYTKGSNAGVTCYIYGVAQ